MMATTFTNIIYKNLSPDRCKKEVKARVMLRAIFGVKNRVKTGSFFEAILTDGEDPF